MTIYESKLIPFSFSFYESKLMCDWWPKVKKQIVKQIIHIFFSSYKFENVYNLFSMNYKYKTKINQKIENPRLIRDRLFLSPKILSRSSHSLSLITDLITLCLHLWHVLLFSLLHHSGAAALSLSLLLIFLRAAVISLLLLLLASSLLNLWVLSSLLSSSQMAEMRESTLSYA